MMMLVVVGLDYLLRLEARRERKRRWMDRYLALPLYLQTVPAVLPNIHSVKEPAPVVLV